MAMLLGAGGPLGGCDESAGGIGDRDAWGAAARGLGRTYCGTIEVGLRGNIAVWDASRAEAAGSWDPVALLLAGSARVRHLCVNRQVVGGGQRLTTICRGSWSDRTGWRGV